MGQKIVGSGRLVAFSQGMGCRLSKYKESINSEQALARIASYHPDVLVSIAGNQLFKRPLIELASKACINLHTALLPKYRGLMPTFWF